MKFYLIFFLIVVLGFLTKFQLMAQKENSFSREQLEKFVAIYMESKNISINRDSILADILHKSHLDADSYALILRNSIENDDKTVLRQNETIIKEINRVNFELQKLKEKNRDELCIKYDLDKDVFLSVLDKYRSDPLFQNGLVTYFEEYINRK